MPPDRGMPWLGYMLILIKRLLDSKYILVQTTNSGMYSNGIKSTPDLIGITDEGRAFIEGLGLHEL